jgi:Winged helix-turn-helix DNA-binding
VEALEQLPQSPLGSHERPGWLRRRCSNLEIPLRKEQHLSRIQQVIETLEAERAHVQKHLAWLEQQINEFHTHSGDSAAAAPARSVRRATARRASNRRAKARSHQVDVKPRIIDFLAQHPGSTAGVVAKGLNLNPGSVSTRLTQLAKSGEIKKASRGYTTK